MLVLSSVIVFICCSDILHNMNKFTGCFYVNSPRSIGCEEKVKEAKKKKRQSTILGGQKREKKENCERCSFFYFPKSCNSNWTATKTTTIAWSATQSYWLGKVLTSSSFIHLHLYQKERITFNHLTTHQCITQCPTMDLDKKSLPRPKTTTAWKPRSNINKN